MKFVEVEVVMNPEGKTENILVNPERVCRITPIVIPTELEARPGVPINKPGVGIDFGSGLIPAVGTIEEIQHLLETGEKLSRIELE